MKRIYRLVLCLLLALAAFCTARADGGAAARQDEAARLMQEAREQFLAGDRTPLEEPVVYRILWIGYTCVRYEGLEFRMTGFDREYLEAVTVNFERYVEKTAGQNLDVIIDLRFVDREALLTCPEGGTKLYLTRDTAWPDILRLSEESPCGYDTVITTVQSQGQENAERNRDREGYGVYTVMLGAKSHGMENDMGYSAFDLGEPKEGTWPLRDPEIPSLYATAVAVHEWLHQLEYLGTLLDVPYPPTHAYYGPPEYEGYRKIEADRNNYDYFEFYEQVLTGTVPYESGSGTELLGLYPKMFRLFPRAVLNPGTWTIRTGAEDGKYLAADGTKIVLSDEPYPWTLRCTGDRSVILSSAASPELRMDLDNARDNEGNPVKLNPPSSVPDAQKWILEDNGDGSCSIRTVYASGRALALDEDGQNPSIRSGDGGGISRWYFMPGR